MRMEDCWTTRYHAILPIFPVCKTHTFSLWAGPCGSRLRVFKSMLIISAGTSQGVCDSCNYGLAKLSDFNMTAFNHSAPILSGASNTFLYRIMEPRRASHMNGGKLIVVSLCQVSWIQTSTELSCIEVIINMLCWSEVESIPSITLLQTSLGWWVNYGILFTPQTDITQVSQQMCW